MESPFIELRREWSCIASEHLFLSAVKVVRHCIADTAA